LTKHVEVSFTDLLDKVSTYMDEEDIQRIKDSYHYASEIYFGYQSMTGENYVSHPIKVAYILTSVQADAATICAALLHNIYKFDDSVNIEQKFGKEVASLIDGVTKLKKLTFDLSTESSISMQRKILVGLTDDVRVIIIRLAERVQEMRDLWIQPPKEQKRIAIETLEVLTPIAHRLGMNQFKSELEDLSLRYYKPDVYFDIVDQLNQTKSERDYSVKMMIEDVSKLLNEHGIKHKIKGRAKSIYSIYKKLDKGKKFSDIYDLLALRVFVDTEAECYQAIGIIHSKYKPLPKRFKDYIAMPKTNMYQSLHTTVFGYDGYLFEIQIRTYEMDEVAERGIASHWSYKENGSNKIAHQNLMDQKLQFFRSIMDLNNEDTTDEEFVSSIKEEFNSTIYVFTPNGDVIELPSGATPIDFAYKVHSAVGEKMVGALVNNSIVPLDYPLHNQDIVKINTNKNSMGPSREWINMAKTAQAKNKIRAFFKKQDKEEYLKKGEEILNKELHKRKISASEFFQEENMKQILEEYKFSDFNEIYIGIGDNKISPAAIINIYTGDNDSKEDILLKKVITPNKTQSLKKDIIVEGIDDIKVKLAACCRPIPGDSIIGFITRGYGISIHRMNCPNLNDLNERLIHVSWGDTEGKKFVTSIVIQCEKKDNILLEIVSKASNHNINIESIHTYNEQDFTTFSLDILVENESSLTKFIRTISSVPNIVKVERSIR